MNRDPVLDEITNRTDPFDILVIGGGATGLGAAVDAAARGYQVLLVEQCDFSKGTSSRSTKLVHGGVRYLQQGNISLVLEALKERGLLYRNAPHLVHNMAFVIPTYSWWQGPFYGIGMKVYDRMAGRLGLSPSRILSREETIEAIPTIETEDLIQGVQYHDGQFDDSRLAVNLAQTIFDLGGRAVNHAKVVGLMKESGLVCGVLLKDELSGKEMEVRSRCVINATGVFVDDIRRMNNPDVSNIVVPSQGVHLVLPRYFLPGDSAIMIPKTSDGRVLFAVPWHDHVIVGTTDTLVAKATLDPLPLAEEKEFLMTESARYLTNDPTPSDVCSIFAGLRPLVNAGESEDTKAISRDHSIYVDDTGLLTITGGKWTTYRKMALDVIDQAELVAGVGPRPCCTESLQIHGWTHQSPQNDNLDVYGADAESIRTLSRNEPELQEHLIEGLDIMAAQVTWAVRHEMAQTVEDVLARRTRALLLNAKGSIVAAEKTARWMARENGRNEAWVKDQVSSYREVANGYVFS
jgi:glycerol-3-phosphate dehydrogenase